MRIFLKNILLLTFIRCPAWTAYLHENGYQVLPHEILEKILKEAENEEFFQANLICENWRKCYEKMCEKQCCNTLTMRTRSLESYYKNYHNYYTSHCLGKINTLKVCELDDEKIRKIILSHRYDEIRNALLKKQERLVIMQAKTLSISKPNELLAFFVAHCVINIFTPYFACQKTKRKFKIKNFPYLCHHFNKVAWKNAPRLIRDSIRNGRGRLNEAKEAAFIGAYRIEEEVQPPADCVAKMQRDTNDAHLLLNILIKWTELCILSKISTINFLNRYFPTAYDAAFEKLKDIDIIEEQARDIIARHSWALIDVAHVPHVISLKNIIDNIPLINTANASVFDGIRDSL